MARRLTLTTGQSEAPSLRALRTQVDTIPGVVSLDAYFDALFALARRVESDATAQPKAA